LCLRQSGERKKRFKPKRKPGPDWKKVPRYSKPKSEELGVLGSGSVRMVLPFTNFVRSKHELRGKFSGDGNGGKDKPQ